MGWRYSRHKSCRLVGAVPSSVDFPDDPRNLPLYRDVILAADNAEQALPRGTWELDLNLILVSSPAFYIDFSPPFIHFGRYTPFKSYSSNSLAFDAGCCVQVFTAFLSIFSMHAKRKCDIWKDLLMSSAFKTNLVPLLWLLTATLNPVAPLLFGQLEFKFIHCQQTSLLVKHMADLRTFCKNIACTS